MRQRAVEGNLLVACVIKRQSANTKKKSHRQSLIPIEEREKKIVQSGGETGCTPHRKKKEVRAAIGRKFELGEILHSRMCISGSRCLLNGQTRMVMRMEDKCDTGL